MRLPSRKAAAARGQDHGPRGEPEACGRYVIVCPTGALSRREDGESRIDKEHCIGCFDCMNVCHTHGVDIYWVAELYIIS